MVKTTTTSLLFAMLLMAANVHAQSIANFSGKPVYKILTKRNNGIIGSIHVELFPNIAPEHVRNFDSLVNAQFLDSTAFHRVIPGFMIQGGDPNSKHGPRATWGMGDPNQLNINAEFSAAHHVRGTLSAARDANINSANSQFFICVAPASWLDTQYSIYGKVVSGMDVVDTIVNAPRDANDNPYDKIEMFVTYVGSNDTVPNAPLLNTPATATTGTSLAVPLKWFAVNGAIIYHIEVSTDSLFATFHKSVDVANLNYTVTGLSTDTKYYWRVKTNNGGHYSSYSEVRNFTTLLTGLKENTIETETLNIFPNPGNGIFTVELPEEKNNTNMLLNVYNVLGETVYSTKGQKNKFTIDISKEANGIYFLELTGKKHYYQRLVKY